MSECDEHGIFNADEADFFKTNDTTFKFKGENWGKKTITVFICVSMKGNGKRNLLVIGKALKPCWFIKLLIISL